MINRCCFIPCCYEGIIFNSIFCCFDQICMKTFTHRMCRVIFFFNVSQGGALGLTFFTSNLELESGYIKAKFREIMCYLLIQQTTQSPTQILPSAPALSISN